MREGRWVIRKYVSGPVVEKSKVWINDGAKGKKRAHRVKGNTNAKKADANARAADKQFARELNANFSMTPSLLLGLSYDDGHLPEGMKECRKDAGNFLRKLKRHLKALGVENVRTETVCSDMDGETGEIVREHIHIVITGEGISFHDGEWWAGNRSIAEIWGKGGAYAKNVRQGSDLTPLAVYLLRQVRKVDNGKKWNPSRNLKKPVITEEDCASGKEMRVPAGVVVRERNYDAETGHSYVRYIKPVKRNNGRTESSAPTEKKAKASGKDGAAHGV